MELSELQQLGKVITEYVKEHTSKVLPLQLEGKAYYLTKNPDIMGKKKEYWSPTQHRAIEDPYAANHKVASSYVKLLVDQKISYSINDKMTITDDKKQEERIKEVLGFKKFKKCLRKVAKDACNKIYGCVQFYVNAQGEFAYKYIPSEQVIRVPNADDGEITDAVIRYYDMDVIDGSGEPKTISVAEYWDSQQTVYYSKASDDDTYQIAPQTLFPINPKPHMTRTVKAAETVLEQSNESWGMPPFAFLYNNDERQRDLDPILPLIKVWDIVESDFANNLDDFQDVFWILKGYGGQDIEEFFEEVKKFKAIKTDAEGSAEAKTVQIPVEAREKMLDRLEKCIYKFGRGVNADDIQGDITNVRIYSLYSGLDLKANEFEMEINEFLDQTLMVLNKYLSVTRQEVISEESVDIRFKRSMIIDKASVITTLTSQQGFLSKQTLLELHPDIDDVDEELRRIKKDEDELSSKLGGGLDFEDEDDKEGAK